MLFQLLVLYFLLIPSTVPCLLDNILEIEKVVALPYSIYEKNKYMQLINFLLFTRVKFSEMN